MTESDIVVRHQQGDPRKVRRMAYRCRDFTRFPKHT